MADVSSVEDLLHCQFSSWYPSFQNLCYKTRLISLPPEFTTFLVSDFVFGHTKQIDDTNDQDSDGDEDASSASGSQGICDPCEEFPDIMNEIDQAIQDLEGNVVPKLNWSAPTDTSWLLPNQQIKCTSASEVVMILKSSDRIAHDICNAFDHCPDPSAPPVDYVLALRKWQNLRPESEFRCFVRENRLVGISQREVTQFFPQLTGRENDIEFLLDDFFEERVRKKFPLANYTYDVYITSKNRVRLVDFNPIGGATSPLLFTWDELKYCSLETEDNEDQEKCVNQTLNNTTSEVEPEDGIPVKVVKDSGGLMLGSKMAYGMPYDLVDCSVADMVSAMQKLEAD